MADYVLEGPHWGGASAATSGGGTITWAVDSTVPASFVSILTAAFDDWTSHANIKFQQVASTSTAKIGFSDAFIDGPSNTLGYTNYTYSGQNLVGATIKFDSGENWVQSGSQVISSTNVNLMLVALHEIGHAIGLDHYNAGKAVMNAVLDRSVTDLTASDIDGVQALYGPPSHASQLANAYGTAIHDTVGPAGEVYALYDGMLGRAPDSAGLTAFSNALASGTSLHDVAQAILGSPEGQSHLGATANADFVSQLYQSVLGRTADASGLQSWTSALDHGADRADVVLNFVFSNENLAQLQPALNAGVFIPDSNAVHVAQLYYGLLDRAPDAGGLGSFASAIAHGTTLHDVSGALLSSTEYRTTSTGLSDGQFVDAMYGLVLGRAGDSAGEQSWNSALAQGTGRATVVNNFTDSLEFQNKYAGQGSGAYVEGLYEHVLGRQGDAGGVQNWTASLDAHALSRTDVAHAFTASAEFQNKYVAPADATFVDTLYENALGRHADAGGLASWTTALAQGASRADVAIGIAESPEAQQHLASQIAQSWHLA